MAENEARWSGVDGTEEVAPEHVAESGTARSWPHFRPRMQVWPIEAGLPAVKLERIIGEKGDSGFRGSLRIDTGMSFDSFLRGKAFASPNREEDPMVLATG